MLVKFEIEFGAVESWTLELSKGNYTWNCLAYDKFGESTFADSNRTLKINYSHDSTAPNSISNLTSILIGDTWAYWNWTNPIDVDFNESIIYIDGINIVNTSLNYYNATSLRPDSNHTITIHTKDNSGNVNSIDVNNTIRTQEDNSSPIINSISDYPDPVNRNNHITILVNATDNYNISRAWVEVEGYNYTMLENWYLNYYQIQNSSTTPGMHNYTIHVKDEFNNTVISETRNFTIENRTQSYVLDGAIKDALGNEINSTIEIYYELNDLIAYKQTKARHNFKFNEKLKYKMVLEPENHKVKKIEVRNLSVKNNTNNIIDIDDPEDNQGFDELYAINPLMNFTSANVTVTATGTKLYKCKDWNFTEQTCYCNSLKD
jgi:hypothetical protein